MDKIRVRKEMVALIESLQQYTHKLASGDSIPQAELDKILKEVTELHRNAVVLDYLTSLKAAVDRGEVSPLKVLDLKEEKEPELIKRTTEHKAFEPAVEIKPEELAAEEIKPQALVSEPKPPVAEVIVPPVPEQITTQEKEVVPEKKKPHEKEVKQEEPSKTAQPDLFGNVLPPVVPDAAKEKAKDKPKEKLQETVREDKSLASKLQKKPITDLKLAIGINEKFQFVNELFGGNMTEYNIAINQVNICGSREEAEAYLDTLRDLYKWKPDDETVMAFSDLVERRFL